MNPRNKVVIIYDFDKTLTHKDMQEYGLLQDLGYDNPELFWDDVKEFTHKHHVDPILGYMYELMRLGQLNNKPMTKALLREYGKAIEFVPGVDEWFQNLEKLSKTLNVTIEHVIVSSGLTSMIQGSSIAKYFSHVYGCEYVYNEHGEAIWCAYANNYTMKTQFIARIHKEAHDLSDHVIVNEKKSKPAVPYSHMIYIGDGFSDVASMLMIYDHGGLSLGVYHENQMELAQILLKDGRVHGVYEADYHLESALYQKVAAYISYITKP
ncbi:MAG: haloacid dehalogenase-like hydrolase [Erysipelothrix sp.]|jgi:2-hydroxy-3-keto-5-methylthiopentenyl-1-phosphate phosphatase|nr:haloacid dehalogenase-like hydrolase [Erysipelothrix sp.]